MKQCTKCLRFLSEEKFTKRGDSVDKLRSQCRGCNNKANLQSYHACDKKERKKSTYKYNLRINYGLSVEKYNKLFLSQDGKCVICERPISNRFLNIEGKTSVLDHCHKTGKNRNILCSGCNTGLGAFNESLVSLDKASKYIEKYSL